jgi:hypothetical protein
MGRDVARNVRTSLSPWGRVGVGLKSTEEIKKISAVMDVKKPFFDFYLSCDRLHLS